MFRKILHTTKEATKSAIDPGFLVLLTLGILFWAVQGVLAITLLAKIFRGVSPFLSDVLASIISRTSLGG